LTTTQSAPTGGNHRRRPLLGQIRLSQVLLQYQPPRRNDGIIVAPPRLPAVAGGARPPLTGRAGDRRDGGQRAAGLFARTSGQRDHQLPGSGLVAVLAQPNALPRAQRQLAIGDRDCQGAAQEAGLHVRGLKGRGKALLSGVSDRHSIACNYIQSIALPKSAVL